MATVTTSFSSVTVGLPLMVKHGDQFTYSISGTYNLTIQLQKSTDGGASWTPILTNSTANATLSDTLVCETTGGANGYFRFQCTARTSGTCDTELSDVSTEVIVGSEIKNKSGTAVLYATESGVVVTGNLDVSGTVSTGGSGGSDYTVNVSDDISLTAGDDFLIDAGGALTITSDETLALTVTDAGADFSVTAADDILLNATDDLVLDAGGLVSITSDETMAIDVTDAGADLNVTAADAVTITATAGTASFIATAGAVAITATAGAVGITSGGDLDVTAVGATSDVTMTSGRNVDINAGSVGYVQITATDGDIGLTTNGTGDDIILSAATNGGQIYLNGGVRFDYASTAVSASTTWRAIMGVNDNSGARTITLEADTNAAGHLIIVKDEAGTAGSANPITITPESGTIDGAASALISENYGSIGLYGNGTNWFTMFNDAGLMNQSSNATLIGAVAVPASGTTAVKITRLGPFFSLTFTLTAVRIAVTDAGAAGAFGATKLFDFVEGGLSFLGCRQNYTAYTPDGTGVPTDDQFVIGVGTTNISAASDAVLAAGEQNVGASIAQTLVAGTTTGTGFTAANSAFDGTGTAADLYLNYSGDDVTTDGNGTLDVTGTITVVGTFLGDD